MRRGLRKICVYLPDKLVMEIDNLRTYGKLINFKNPKYYGEKIQCIKAKGNLERYKNLVDKYLVREYIKEKIGEEYLPKLLGVYNKVEEIDYKKLPEKFILKLNDGSDRNIICKNKSILDIKKTNKKLKKLLKEDYYKYTKEPQYKNIDKKIICEELLEDYKDELVEYSLHCFSGKVELIEMDTDPTRRYKEYYFQPDWKRIKVRKKGGDPLKKIEKPKFSKELISLGEFLAKNFEYVRVDFNIVNDKIYFSELTFTPDNGTYRFEPLEYDEKIAKLINLDRYNNAFNYYEELSNKEDKCL